MQGFQRRISLRRVLFEASFGRSSDSLPHMDIHNRAASQPVARFEHLQERDHMVPESVESFVTHSADTVIAGEIDIACTRR